MSEEHLSAFLEKVKFDTKFQEKLKIVASPEIAHEIARATMQSESVELYQGLQLLQKIIIHYIQSMKSESVEPSNERLEAA